MDAYRHFYYNAAWQIVETRNTSSENTAPDTVGMQATVDVGILFGGRLGLDVHFDLDGGSSSGVYGIVGAGVVTAPSISVTGYMARGDGSYSGPFNEAGLAVGPVTIGGFEGSNWRGLQAGVDLSLVPISVYIIESQYYNLFGE